MPNTGAETPHSVAAAQRDPNGWEAVLANHVSLSLKDGIVRMSDHQEDVRLMAQPSDVDFNIGDDHKPGTIRFSFGSDSHGFEFQLDREAFERIMAAAANEWGYEISDADTTDTEDTTDV